MEVIVRPLLTKPGLDENVLRNYRPVLNPAFYSKILQRIVRDQVMDYLFRNYMLVKFQSAYRPDHSTEPALLRVHNDVMLALND